MISSWLRIATAERKKMVTQGKGVGWDDWREAQSEMLEMTARWSSKKFCRNLSNRVSGSRSRQHVWTWRQGGKLDSQGKGIVRRYQWEPQDLGMLWKDHINQEKIQKEKKLILKGWKHFYGILRETLLFFLLLLVQVSPSQSTFLPEISQYL